MSESDAEGLRCPHCDTLNAESADNCIGCHQPLENRKPRRPHSEREKALGIVGGSRRPVVETAPEIVETIPDKPKAPTNIADLLLRAVTVILVGVAIYVGIDLRRNTPPLPTQTVVAVVAETVDFVATATPTPAPVIATATATPLAPTDTPEPTATPTSVPTPTLEPPFEHVIQSGEALINLALRYQVSLDSILENNPGLVPESIVSGQTILVPRPTATPPLVPIEVDVNGQTLLADPAACVMHEIADADTYIKIAQQYSVPLNALLEMNRLSTDNILQPGDRVCIPTITYTIASETVGDAESSSEFGVFATADRPTLLYPPQYADILTLPITLQWLAERTLGDSEWYMLEVTNLSDPTARPQRIFTQQSSYQLPESWYADGADNQFRWRVSYVQVLSLQANGAFVYDYGGPSGESYFTIKVE